MNVSGFCGYMLVMYDDEYEGVLDELRTLVDERERALNRHKQQCTALEALIPAPPVGPQE